MSAERAFYLSAGLIGAIGLALALWSLFLADRSRGRRRCPKCWYDMAGLGESRKCPECGREPRSERALFRTRRRWRPALLAFVLLIGAAGLAVTPQVREKGWARCSPNTVLVVLAGMSNEAGDAAFNQLAGRVTHNARGGWVAPDIGHGKLWEWQWWIAARSCRARLRDPALRKGLYETLNVLEAAGAQAGSALPEVLILLKSPGTDTYGLCKVVAQIGPEARAAVPDLVALLERPQVRADYYAGSIIQALGEIGPDARAAVPVLVECLTFVPTSDFGSTNVPAAAARSLGSIGPGAADAVSPLLLLSHTGSGQARAAALEALGRIDPAADRVEDALFTGLLDDDVDIRDCAKDAMKLAPALLDRALRRISDGLRDDESAHRMACARAAAVLGSSAAALEESLTGLLSDPDPLVRAYAALAIRRSGTPDGTRILGSLSNDSDVLVRAAALSTAMPTEGGRR